MSCRYKLGDRGLAANRACSTVQLLGVTLPLRRPSSSTLLEPPPRPTHLPPLRFPPASTRCLCLRRCAPPWPTPCWRCWPAGCTPGRRTT